MSRIAPRSRLRPLTAAALGSLMLMTAGCATTYGANEVSPNAVRTAATVRPGVVLSVREVTIRPENSAVGAGAGAILGGLLGSQVGGRDTTQAIGAVGGAVLGGLAGNAAGRAAGTARGFAYVVEFENGEAREIVQGADVLIAPGTPVNVTFRADGAIVTPS
ncbi:MAG: glycine zipper 2TM domain-containing protein [Pseudomonadota bacterium]